MRWIFIVLFMVPMFLFAQPTPLDVANSTPYTDENSVTLQDGDIIQLLYAGADNTIDPPVLTIGQPTSGQPTDDDVVLETHIIGENQPPGFGLFSFTTTAFSANIWR